MEVYAFEEVIDDFLENDVLLETNVEDEFFENQMLIVDDSSFNTTIGISSEERLLMYPKMHRLEPLRKITANDAPLIIESIITEDTLLQVPDVSYDISKCIGDGPRYDQEVEVVADSPSSDSDDSKSQCGETTDELEARAFRLFAEAFLCEQCRFCFRSKGTFNAHQNKHMSGDTDNLIPRSRVGCSVETCDVQCENQVTLIQHLQIHHDQQQLVFDMMEFDNIEEFNEWKSDFESATNSKYTKKWAKKSGQSNSSYFFCHRSGTLPLKKKPGQRARNSHKMGRNCSSYFKVREQLNGKVSIRGCLKHFGHDVTAVEKIPLSNDIKKEIASYLLEGLDENEIVELMRDNSQPGERRHYIRIYEVRNIYRKLDRNVKKSDLTSILDQIKDNISKKVTPQSPACSETETVE